MARSHWPAICVLLTGVAVTSVVADQLERTTHARDQERFARDVDRLQDAVSSRLDTYVAMLRAGAALANVTPGFGAGTFRGFVEGLELQSLYPGIQGVGFTRRVPARNLPSLIADRRAAGDAAFQVWPEGQRGEYHAVVHLEPLDRRNAAAIGYDMFTDPTRREAMERARDTGEPAASEPVTLVQEIEGNVQPGFLIYMPVYEAGSVPATLEERRAQLLGFVFSPFRAGDLFAGILGTGNRPRTGFELVDARSPDVVLHRSSVADAPRFTTTRHIDAAGSPWIASMFSLPALEDDSAAGLVRVTIWTGLGISLLLSVLVALQTKARHRIERSDAQVQQLLANERTARSEVERVSRLKDEFLATLGHELRTPLNAIQGWAHMLTTAALSDEKKRHAVATILRNATMQAKLIEDLLDMSRIVSNRVRLDPHRLDLVEVIEAAIGTLRPTADAKGITIAWAFTAAPQLHGDAGRLQQVFWNLLSNAVKFTPAGGHVDVSLRSHGTHAIVEVRDTGVGIAPEFLPRAFDRFRQADGSITRQQGGLGLGLSIVKSLVELHGGSVGAISAGLHQGATFTVTLPVAAATRADAAGPVHAPVRPCVPPARDVLAGVRVLAVDDDADARDLLRDILAEYGARVSVAASAAEALRVFHADPRAIDLLVSDIGMPETDGYELITEIRRAPRQLGGAVPAIAVTAFAGVDDHARALAAGYQSHIAKPVTPHEVVAACAMLCQQPAVASS